MNQMNVKIATKSYANIYTNYNSKQHTHAQYTKAAFQYVNKILESMYLMHDNLDRKHLFLSHSLSREYWIACVFANGLGIYKANMSMGWTTI